jgi:hypothetical protein
LDPLVLRVIAVPLVLMLYGTFEVRMYKAPITFLEMLLRMKAKRFILVGQTLSEHILEEDM